MTAPKSLADEAEAACQEIPARRGIFGGDVSFVRDYASGAAEEDELEIIGEGEDSLTLPTLATPNEIVPVVRGNSYAIASHPARLVEARAQRATKTCTASVPVTHRQSSRCRLPTIYSAALIRLTIH